MSALTYMGRAGALVPFPKIQVGYQSPVERVGATHELADGGTVVDLLGWRRRWTLSMRVLDPTERGQVEQLFLAPGWAGPLRLLDGEQRNLLTAQQATCGDVTADTTGFSVSAGTLGITSTSSQVTQGLRAVSWQLSNGTSAGAELRWTPGGTLNPGSPLHPVPVVGGEQMTFSVSLRLSSGSQVFHPRLVWLDTSGSTVSTSDPGSKPSVTTSYARLTVTGTVPAGAAYVLPVVRNENTISPGVTVYADAAQLERAATASTWVIGLGVPVVDLSALSRTLLWDDAAEVELEVLELSTIDGR